MTCNCATFGSALHCGVHTQADYDAQQEHRPVREETVVTEQGLRDFAQKMLNLGWEYGQGYHDSAGAQFQLRRYLWEFFGVNAGWPET